MFKHSLVLATALYTMTACSKPETESKADRAAQAVINKANDVRAESNDVRTIAANNRNNLSAKVQDNRDVLAQDLKDVAARAAARAGKTDARAKADVDAINGEMKDVTKELASLDEAQNEFAVQRHIRVETLRVVHGIEASQAGVISVVSTSAGFDAGSRAAISEKLGVFSQRLDTAATLIQGLEGVDAKSWIDRERAAADAMNGMEDARSSTWDAVKNAKRIDPRTTMR